jgi:hypothetical protein
MTRESEELIQQLHTTGVLFNLGKIFTIGSKNIPLQQWIKSRSWDEWERLKLSWRNEMTEWLAINHSARFNAWSAHTAVLRPIISELVERIALPADIEDVATIIRGAVAWDLLAILMEKEYADLEPPAEYWRAEEVYLAGNFPCGWLGKFPEGELLSV